MAVDVITGYGGHEKREDYRSPRVSTRVSLSVENAGNDECFYDSPPPC